MTNNTIIYVKKDTDGVVSEEIHLQLKDIRYPSTQTEVQMSLEGANHLLAQLSAKLSTYPY